MQAGSRSLIEYNIASDAHCTEVVQSHSQPIHLVGLKCSHHQESYASLALRRGVSLGLDNNTLYFANIFVTTPRIVVSTENDTR